MTSTTHTRRRPHAVGAKGTAVGKPVGRTTGPTDDAERVTERDDAALIAALERDVDSTDETRLEAMFEEPSHVDDEAILDDADGTGTRRR